MQTQMQEFMKQITHQQSLSLDKKVEDTVQAVIQRWNLGGERVTPVLTPTK
jgi:hypothetical protein